MCGSAYPYVSYYIYKLDLFSVTRQDLYSSEFGVWYKYLQIFTNRALLFTSEYSVCISNLELLFSVIDFLCFQHSGLTKR